MKLLHILSFLAFFAVVGCASQERIPASEINNVQAHDPAEERYIYGSESFARETQM